MIGSKLKELRKNWGLSLEEVSQYVGISTDMMSKIERGDRKPTIELLKKLTIHYNLHEDDLLIYFYTEELYETLKRVELKSTIVKELRKKVADDGYEYRIRNTNPLKPEHVRKKRVTLGGLNRVRGFGYYIQKNDKLSKKNRETLLHDGSVMMEELIGGELDSTHTDMELLEHWNDFFQQYGYRFPQFEKEWIRVYGKQPKQSKRTKVEEPTDKPFKPFEYKSSIFNSFLNKPKVSGFGEERTPLEE